MYKKILFYIYLYYKKYKKRLNIIKMDKKFIYF